MLPPVNGVYSLVSKSFREQIHLLLILILFCVCNGFNFVHPVPDSAYYHHLVSLLESLKVSPSITTSITHFGQPPS